MNELGKRLTSPDLWWSHPDQALDLLLKPTGLTYEAFCELGVLQGERRFRKYAETGFRTPSGKVELMLSKAQAWKLPALPGEGLTCEPAPEGYPLILTSAKPPDRLGSSYGWTEAAQRRCPHPLVELHPQTAAPLGIRSNDPVWIETPHGRIQHIACLTERVPPGVVYAAYGWWDPEPSDPLRDRPRVNFNHLTSAAAVGQAFGTPDLGGIPCRLAPADRPAAIGQRGTP